MSTTCDCLGDTTQCNLSCSSASGLSYEEAIDAMQTWDSHFSSAHGWNSWNDAGAVLRTFFGYRPIGAQSGYEHCGTWHDNLGLGNPSLPEDGTVLIGNVGIDDRELHYHEFVHGWLSKAAGLTGISAVIPQVTVIGEHLGDSFGVLLSTQTGAEAWKWPEDADTQFYCGMRSFADPSTSTGSLGSALPQPKEWSYFLIDPNNPLFEPFEDYQHVNDGVLNYLVYLLSASGTFNGISVPAVGAGDLEDILFSAGTNYLGPSSNLDGYRYALQSAAIWQDVANGDFPALPLTHAVLDAANAVGLWEPNGPIYPDPAYFYTTASPAAVVLEGPLGTDELFVFTRSWGTSKLFSFCLNLTRADGDPAAIGAWSLPDDTEIFITDSPVAVADSATVAKVAITRRPYPGWPPIPCDPNVVPCNPNYISVIDYDAAANSPNWQSTITWVDVPDTAGTGDATSLRGPAIANFEGKVYVFYVYNEELYVWSEGSSVSIPMTDTDGKEIGDVHGQPTAVVDGGRLWVHYPRGGTRPPGSDVYQQAHLAYTSTTEPGAADTWAVSQDMETSCGLEDVDTIVDSGLDEGASVVAGIWGGYTYLAFQSSPQNFDDPSECGEWSPCATSPSRGMAHVRLLTSGDPEDVDYAEISCAVLQNTATTGEYGETTSVGAMVEYMGRQWALYAESRFISRKNRSGR